jgi:membrane peptidoglycan carboxypeptidase
MGHEIGVTALQAVAAFASIASGGEYIPPYIVSEVTSPSGEILEQHRSEPRRVVSEETAATLKKMLESVVIHGTGKRAQIGGYRAAGKTGTAQKVDETTGRYSKTRYVASFAGFAPADHPEIACIVSLDEPKGAYHGGDAAAPIFARVVADALHILAVPPEDDPRADLVAGDFRSFELAPTTLDEAVAEEETDARPALDVVEGAGEPETASKQGGTVVVPDLTGRGVREAVALCAARGLKIKATGEGLVTGQSPPPGTLVAEDAVCVVRLSKLAARRHAGGESSEDGRR